ncbi:MAG: plasmid mobilization relaxosome protein MobC [Clostridiales bacterium]|nr:plasmid mobilization relaxosome protein MobC [Clostridiales bacterium]
MQKKKTKIITARMTPADKQAIYQRAKAAGMTVTAYLTTCALDKEIVRVDGLDDLLSELKAQGRNLNQLTTLANIGRISILRGDDLVREYTRLCDILSALVREVR